MKCIVGWQADIWHFLSLFPSEMCCIQFESRQTQDFRTGLTLSYLQVFIKLWSFEVNHNLYVFKHLVLNDHFWIVAFSVSYFT